MNRTKKTDKRPRTVTKTEKRWLWHPKTLIQMFNLQLCMVAAGSLSDNR
jgi:hypothetical protein